MIDDIFAQGDKERLQVECKQEHLDLENLKWQDQKFYDVIQESIKKEKV